MEHHMRTTRAKVTSSASGRKSYVAHISFLRSVRTAMTNTAVIRLDFFDSSKSLLPSEWLIRLVLDMGRHYLFVTDDMSYLVTSGPRISILALRYLIDSFGCSNVFAREHISINSSPLLSNLIIWVITHGCHRFPCENFPLKDSVLKGYVSLSPMPLRWNFHFSHWCIIIRWIRWQSWNRRKFLRLIWPSLLPLNSFLRRSKSIFFFNLLFCQRIWCRCLVIWHSLLFLGHRRWVCKKNLVIWIQSTRQFRNLRSFHWIRLGKRLARIC